MFFLLQIVVIKDLTPSIFLFHVKQAAIAMMGLSRYAMEDFVAAKKYWKEAVSSLREMKKRKKSVALLAELLNNLGCVHFETGNEIKAIKLFEDSLEMQRKAVTRDVYDHGMPPTKTMLMKLAITQANIAYINLRLKNIDAAIKAFECCQKVILSI